MDKGQASHLGSKSLKKQGKYYLRITCQKGKLYVPVWE